MPTIRISKEASSGTYFLSMTVKNHYYIFDRHNRFDILADSIKYCQDNKKLSLYAYVFMLNHIHLIASAPDMISFIRDFKKFTSKRLHENITVTEPGALGLFETNGKFELWENSNMPKAIENESYLLQKANYIHNNPVRKQYVKRPEDWLWSSANPESPIAMEPLPL